MYFMLCMIFYEFGTVVSKMFSFALLIQTNSLS